MKVELKLSSEIKEPYAVIHASELTPEVNRVVALLEGVTENLLTVSDNERITILHPDEICMVRIENERTVLYTKTARHVSAKRLYELEAALGAGFMRISKSVLVNLQCLECVEPSLGGVMLLVLKNGCKDYISRKYLPAFKKYLGL